MVTTRRSADALSETVPLSDRASVVEQSPGHYVPASGRGKAPSAASTSSRFHETQSRHCNGASDRAIATAACKVLHHHVTFRRYCSMSRMPAWG
jgi:hypothetical protein